MAMMEWEIGRVSAAHGQVQILLCDDDPCFAAKLSVEIQRVFEKMNMGCNIAIFSGMEQISEEKLRCSDMVFLDIDFEEEDYNGIDIARHLRRFNSRALVFFVTNFIDYAPAGYEVQAFRYVLKRDMVSVLERYILQAMEQFAQSQGVLRLRGRDEALELPLEQISYLEVMDHSVSIHAADRCVEISASLSALEEGLSSHGFLRIQKSYLVNMAHIRKFRSRECWLTDGTVLSVSEKNYAQRKQKYLLWKGLN